jgi:hypothetical protein
MEVQLHTFLSSILEGELTPSRPDRFTPRERTSVSIEKQVKWAPDTIRKFWRTKRYILTNFVCIWYSLVKAAINLFLFYFKESKGCCKNNNDIRQLPDSNQILLKTTPYTQLWQILTWSSGLAEGYKMRHCTVPLDLTSGSGFSTVSYTNWAPPFLRLLTMPIGTTHVVWYRW